MWSNIQNYLRDDEGAVTIDWVVLTGFGAGIALSVAAALSGGMETRGTEMVTPVTISTTF